MYVKTIILFICMAISFLQCMDQHDLDPEQRLTVYRVIISNLDSDGKVPFSKLRKIINDSASALRLPMRIPDVMEAPLKFYRSTEALEVNALAFIGAAADHTRRIIEGIAAENVGPDGINLDQLKAVLSRVANRFELPEEFPSHEALQKQINRKPNRIFDLNAVVYYAVAFVVSEDSKFSNIVRNLVLIHANPSGRNDYDVYENIMKGVKLETEILLPYETREEHRRSFFSDFPRGQITVDRVEDIVIDHLTGKVPVVRIF